MSHFLDRLKFLGKAHETFAGGHGAVTLEDRQWENATATAGNTIKKCVPPTA